jgi:hypothetical protein
MPLRAFQACSASSAPKTQRTQVSSRLQIQGQTQQRSLHVLYASQYWTQSWTHLGQMGHNPGISKRCHAKRCHAKREIAWFVN